MSKSRGVLLLAELSQCINVINDDNVLLHEKAKCVAKIESLLDKAINNAMRVDDDKFNLRNYLLSKSLEDQIELMQSIFQGNPKAIHEILSKAILFEEINKGLISEADINAIMNHFPQNRKIHFVTKQTAEQIMLQMICYNIATIKDLRDKLKIETVISKILTSIPDTFIDIPAKAKIFADVVEIYKTGYTNIFPEIDIEDVNIAYIETAGVLKKSKYSGEISLEKYKAATEEFSIQYSDFIILTLGLIQKESLANTKNKTFKIIFESIQESYLRTDYEEALRNIHKLCTEYVQIIGKEKARAILTHSAKLSTKVNMKENYSRRFFENRLAALYQGNVLDYSSLERIAQFYQSDHPTVKNRKQAMEVLSMLSELSSDVLLQRTQVLQDNSRLFAARNRQRKKGFAARQEERTGDKSDTVLSRNLGVMTSSQPNFFDEISMQPIRNKPTDTNKFNAKKLESYSMQHPYGAFVASISGHAYFAVALLEKYAEESLSSTKIIENDVNNFIKDVAIFNMQYGYHGLMEVLDVFTEPRIKNIFSELGVTLKVDWSKELINQAFQDTQAYTLQICLNKSTNLQLLRLNKEVLKQVLPNFFRAIKNNDLQLVKQYLAQGIDPNCFTENDEVTPIFIAAYMGHTEVAKELLKAGADLNVKDNYGNTPFALAAKKGHINMLNLFIDSGKLEINRKKNTTLSPFYIAAYYGHDKILKSLINKMDVNHQDENGYTQLHLAVENEDLKVVEALLKAGANPNVRDKHGNTPFLLAAKDDNIEMMNLLIDSGKLELNVQSNTNLSPLLIAAYYNYIEIVERLIMGDHPGNKMDINSRNINGFTHLQIAVENNFIEVVELLLKAGADPNIEDNNGNTPFPIAAQDGNIEMMNLLINSGKLEFNLQDNTKPSPLYFAAYYGRDKIVERLITGNHPGNKVDVNHQDKSGYTQLHLAVKKGNIQVIEAFLKAGADPDITDVNNVSPFDLAKEKNNNMIINLFHKKKIIASDNKETETKPSPKFPR